MRPVKTDQPGHCPVWSESSVCTHWVAKDPNFLHADSEDSDQTGWMMVMDQHYWKNVDKTINFNMPFFVLSSVYYVCFKSESIIVRPVTYDLPRIGIWITCISQFSEPWIAPWLYGPLTFCHMGNTEVTGCGSLIGSVSTWHASGPPVRSLSGTFIRGGLVMKKKKTTAILPLPLMKKSSCQLLAKEYALSTGKLHRRLAKEKCG